MIDLKELRKGLDQLSGYDMEQLEKECKQSGNVSVPITASIDFQARLAAKALGKNPHDIRGLPIKEYNRVINEIVLFLFSGSENPDQTVQLEK